MIYPKKLPKAIIFKAIKTDNGNTGKIDSKRIKITPEIGPSASK